MVDLTGRSVQMPYLTDITDAVQSYNPLNPLNCGTVTDINAGVGSNYFGIPLFAILRLVLRRYPCQ